MFESGTIKKMKTSIVRSEPQLNSIVGPAGTCYYNDDLQGEEAFLLFVS